MQLAVNVVLLVQVNSVIICAAINICCPSMCDITNIHTTTYTVASDLLLIN